MKVRNIKACLMSGLASLIIGCSNADLSIPKNAIAYCTDAFASMNEDGIDTCLSKNSPYRFFKKIGGMSEASIKRAMKEITENLQLYENFESRGYEVYKDKKFNDSYEIIVVKTSGNSIANNLSISLSYESQKDNSPKIWRLYGIWHQIGHP